MHDQTSPTTYRFAMNVPDGGHTKVNPDVSATVYDKDGNPIRSVARPWAFDAAGRPQKTWYTVDENGDLVQHIEPADNALFPILADPTDMCTPEDMNADGVPDAQTAGAGKAGSADPMVTAADNALNSPAQAPPADVPQGVDPTVVAVVNGSDNPADSNPVRPAPADQSPEPASGVDPMLVGVVNGINDSSEPEPSPEVPEGVDPTAAAVVNGLNNSPEPSSVGVVDTTGHQEGDIWYEQSANGEMQGHRIVPGTDGQTVDSRVARPDGTTSDIRTVDNGQGGWQAWSTNDDGSSAYAGTMSADSGHYSMSWDSEGRLVQTSQSDATNGSGTVNTNNPDGTQSSGSFERVQSNRYVMDVQHPDGSTVHLDSTTAPDGNTNTLVTDDDGTRVLDPQGIVRALDTRGNDLATGTPGDPDTGRFYDPESGVFHDGAVDPSTGGRVIRLGEGYYLVEVRGSNNRQSWATVTPEGDWHAVDAFDIDPRTGDPINIVVRQDPAIKGSEDVGADVAWRTTDTAAAAITAQAALTESGIKTMPGGALSAADSALVKGLGRSAGAAAVVIGTKSDMDRGMSGPKAVITNTAGTAAGIWAGAQAGSSVGTFFGPGVGTAVGFVAGAGVGFAATKLAQIGWDWF